MTTGLFRAGLLLPKHKPGCLWPGLFSGDLSTRAGWDLGLAGWLLWGRDQSSLWLPWGRGESSEVTGGSS